MSELFELQETKLRWDGPPGTWFRIGRAKAETEAWRMGEGFRVAPVDIIEVGVEK